MDQQLPINPPEPERWQEHIKTIALSVAALLRIVFAALLRFWNAARNAIQKAAEERRRKRLANSSMAHEPSSQPLSASTTLPDAQVQPPLLATVAPSRLSPPLLPQSDKVVQSPLTSQSSAGVPALWNPAAVGRWSFLFTWMFGSILVAKNWRALGEIGKARRAMIWIYAGIPIMWLIYEVIPGSLLRGFPLGIYVAWLLIESGPQQKLVKARFGNNYPRKGWAMPLGIAFPVFGLVFLAGINSLFQDATLGTPLEFNKGELYYKPTVSKLEARRLGDFLVEFGVFDGTEKTVQLNKSGNVYQVRIVVKNGIELNEDRDNAMKAFSRMLSQRVFNGAEVDIYLCNENLKDIRVIKP